VENGRKEKKRKQRKRRKKRKKKEINVEELKGKTIVGVDPGKHSIIYLTTDDEIKTKKGRFQYSNVQRASETNRNTFKKWREKKKLENPTIQKLEDQLSQCNSRTVKMEKFQEYLKTRFEIEEKLYSYYSNKMYRIHKWWSFRRKQKSESKLIQDIQNKFGKDKDFVLAYGRWNLLTSVESFSSIRNRMSF